jgi:hypothetical protein
MDIPLQAQVKPSQSHWLPGQAKATGFQAKPSQNITMQQRDATHYYSRNEKEVDTVRQAE